MLYVTYKENGIMKSAKLSQAMYQNLIKNQMVSNVVIHPNEFAMKNAVNEGKGSSGSNARILFG